MNRSEWTIAALSRNTTTPPYRATTRFPLPIRHRPQVTRMRDLSPETKQRVMDEYYKSYDVMTGVRIAATLGGLITLFTLFLIYKSKCKTIRGAAKQTVNKETVDVGTTSSSDSTSTSTNQGTFVATMGLKHDLSTLEEIVIQVPSSSLHEAEAERGVGGGGGDVIVGGSGAAGEVGEASGPPARAPRKERPPLKSSAEGSRSLPCSPYRDKRPTEQPPPPPPPPAPSRERKLSKTSFPSESLTSSFSSKGSGPPVTSPPPLPTSPTPPPPPTPPKPTSRAKDRRRSSCHRAHPRTSVLAGPALMAAAAIAIPGSRGGGHHSQRRREVRGSMRLMSLSSQLSGRRKSTRGPRFLPPWD